MIFEFQHQSISCCLFWILEFNKMSLFGLAFFVTFHIILSNFVFRWVVKKVKYDCSFQDKWLTESEFSAWLNRDKDLTKTYCRLCMKNFSVAKHGIKALVKHTSCSKHKLMLPLSSQAELNFSNKKEKSQSF